MNKIPFLISFSILFSLIVVSCTIASDVVPLTKENFDSSILPADSGFWFVRFYAPWCGHCKAMAQQWEETATQLKGEIHVANVDATVELDLAKQYNIRGYPTMYLFYKNEVYEYHGGRSTRELTTAAQSGAKVLKEGGQPSGHWRHLMKATKLVIRPRKAVPKPAPKLRNNASIRRKDFTLASSTPLYRWSFFVIMFFVIVLGIIVIYLVMNISSSESGEEATSLLNTPHGHSN